MDMTALHTPNSDWRNSNRPLLGLTQTCRQIRAEFLPMYMDNLHVVISCTHVDKYVDLFVLQGKQAEEVEHAQCSMSILATDQDTNFRIEGINVDLLPLLRLCSANPDIQVDICSGVNRTTHLHQVLRFSDEWWDFLEQDITGISLRPKSKRMYLNITVRPEVTEDWMRTAAKGGLRTSLPRADMLCGFGPGPQLPDLKSRWLRERGLVWDDDIVRVIIDHE